MNNKILLLATALIVGVSANSFAAATWITPNNDGTSTIVGTTTGNIVLKPSANVRIAWEAAALGVAYSLGTHHTTGTFTYATTSTETNIYRWLNTNQASPKVPPNTPSSADGNATWEAGWTASK